MSAVLSNISRAAKLEGALSFQVNVSRDVTRVEIEFEARKGREAVDVFAGRVTNELRTAEELIDYTTPVVLSLAHTYLVVFEAW